MHSGNLTQEQIKVLYERIRPMESYLFELEQRMEQREFSEADRLFQEVKAATLNLHLLCDHLHRLWCGPSYPGGTD